MSKDKDEEIPSVRELEALERQDRKETEELLSGFDRPARTPRTPRARDFVDYYSNPSARAVGGGGAGARAPRSERPAEPAAHEKPTVIVPRREGLRATMTWVVAVGGMILFGATIAILATPDAQRGADAAPPAHATATSVGPTVAPTSATTITSAHPQPVEDPADTIVTAPVPPSPSAKKTAPVTTQSGGTMAPTIKTAPREDFIRDM